VASTQDWLDEGLQILAEQGAPAVTIDRLAERMGLTKGSFYHHFQGMSGYKTALLEHFKTHSTMRYIDLVEQDETLGPLAKLDRLGEVVLSDRSGGGLEIAVRAWATQDPEARALQESVDRTRLDYLYSLWLAHSGDPDESVQMARALYLIVIGAAHVMPPLHPDDLRQLYQRMLRIDEPVAVRPARTRRK
jgi:AcrR family transcriptional regulator